MKFAGSKKVIEVAALASVVATVSSPAHAYLDPGTGSFVLQGLLATLAGGAVALKFYWDRLLGLVGRGKMTRKREPAATVETEDCKDL